MRIVSDFDGVLTDQTEEGHRVRELFRDELIRRGGEGAPAVDALLLRADKLMDAHPHQHGWKVAGRITAFVNEDLFVRNNALGACLDGLAAAGDAEAKGLLGRIRDPGVADFNALANVAYEQMVRETSDGKLRPLDPATQTVFKTLLSEGHEIVVVSNSNTARILQLFREAGIEAVGHDEDPKARLRVRGGAAKFALGNQPRGFQSGDYFVEIDRPSYDKILREEKPGAVIGDVFTLDLALPLHLAQTEPAPLNGIQLVLRERDYTPAWSREALRRIDKGARATIIRRLEELPAAFRK